MADNTVIQKNDTNKSDSPTLTKIFSVATTEFLEKGFLGASLREIVKKVGVTTGAFYGYYKSKESLFDALVKESADYVLGIFHTVLHDFESLSENEQTKHMSEYSSVGLKKMFSYAFDHSDAFKLIFRSSTGTKYENYLEQLVEAEVNSTHNFYAVIQKQGYTPKQLDPFTEHMLISGMFSSCFELILHDIPKETGMKNLELLFAFYRAGWYEIMGMKK